MSHRFSRAMQSLDMLYCRLFLLCLAFSVCHARGGECTRRPDPGSTDCSMANGDCEDLYHWSDPSVPVSQLPSTPDNTRTCYRTCFEGRLCKIFPTFSSTQPLRVEGTSPYNFQRVFSPRFNTSDYRKSTICRYSIQCEPGQILSYSVHSFDLEEKGTCDTSEECLDWVEITYHHLNEKARFCGSGQLGEVHIVGHNKITFDFASNRRGESAGFLYFVRCFNESISDTTAESESCTKPHTSLPPTTSLRRLNVLADDTNTVKVERQWLLLYKEDIILIINNKLLVSDKFYGITYLYVENNMSKSPQVYSWSNRYQLFYGYGTLTVYDDIAYYYQTGVDPSIEPSQEEASAILKIEKALNELIELDSYDVVDFIDFRDYLLNYLLSPQTSLPRSPLLSHAQQRVNTDEELVEAGNLAAEFSNACNPLLRATACNYQALVKGTDCKTGLPL